MPRLPRRLRLIAAAATAVVACSDSEGTSAGGAVGTDSAGVTIVDNTAPTLSADAERWRVDTLPILQIGGRSETDTATAFSRIVSAFRMDDGRIAVADGGSNVVRIFDTNGNLMLSVGNHGEGPGEWEGLTRAARLPGDAFITSDLSGRVTRFTRSGAVYQPTAVHMDPGQVEGVMLDGTMLFSPGGVFRPVEVAEGQPGVDSARFLFVSAEGKGVADVGPFPQAMLSGAENPLVGFAPRGRVSVGPRHLFQAFATTYEIRAYDSQARLRQVIRRKAAVIPVLPADRELLIASMLERMGPDAPSDVVASMRKTITAASFPAFGALLADRAGNVWVQEYKRDMDIRSRRDAVNKSPLSWSVFSGDGLWVTDVVVPGGFNMLEIGDDYIVGYATTEFDVPFIRMLRLNKGK